MSIKNIVKGLIISSSFIYCSNGSIEVSLDKSTLNYAETNRVEGTNFIASGKSNSYDVSGINLKFSFVVPSYDLKYEDYGFLDIVYNSRSGNSSFNQENESVSSDTIKHKVNTLGFYWVPDREYNLLFNSSFILGIDYFSWNRKVSNSSTFENKDVTLYSGVIGYEGEYSVFRNLYLSFRGIYKLSLFGNVDVAIKTTNDISESLKLGSSNSYDLSLGVRYYFAQNMFVKLNYTVTDMTIDDSKRKNSYQESETSFKENKINLGVGFIF